MIRAADERFVLGSKENLTENMEAFSLKVNIHTFLSTVLQLYSYSVVHSIMRI